MTGVIATIPQFQFSSSTGAPLAMGTLTVYLAGTTTPTNTWQDSALTALNTNPVQLDASGSCVLWLDSAVAYKFVLKNAGGVVQWTQDNIKTVADVANTLRADLAASTGTSLVGHMPAGVGAVATTAQSKLRERVSIFDSMPDAYKATIEAGTGTVSDAVAITAAIQAKHDAVVLAGSGGGFKEVEFPAGTYHITSLNWSPLVQIKALGNVVFISAITSGICLHVSTEFGDWSNALSKLAYETSPSFIEGKIVLVNSNLATGNSATGVFFGDDGVGTYGCYTTSIHGLYLREWGAGVRFGSHAYIINFDSCNFLHCNSIVFNDVTAGYVDRMERISFTNCVLANSTNVITGDVGHYGDISFVNCSFDYNDRFIANIANIAIISVSGGSHFEWSSDQTLINVAGGSVTVTDSYLAKPSGTNATTLIAAVSGAGSFTHSGNSYNTPGGVELFRLDGPSASITGNKTLKQFGAAAATFPFGIDTIPVNNVGAGFVRLHPELADFAQALGAAGTVRLPGGLTLKYGQIPLTAIGANATVNVTVTFTSAFANAVVYANASVQPDANVDFYGVTQRVITGTPLETTTFAIRNGATPQNFQNGTWFAIGY